MAATNLTHYRYGWHWITFEQWMNLLEGDFMQQARARAIWTYHSDTKKTSTIPTRLEKALAIIKLVKRHENIFKGGDATASIHAVHLQKVLQSLTSDAPVHFILPAFPAKSPNQEKTLGILPDLAEVIALERLNDLCNAIGKLHAPGAKITICSDGRVFSDLVGVEDSSVSAYRRGIESIIADFNFSRLATFHMEDIFPAMDFDEMRMRLIREHGRPLADIRAGVLRSDSERMLFSGIHRFLFEDYLALNAGKTRNRMREETKQVAYQVIQRSNSWSRLVEQYFPEAVRLSIHPQFVGSAKIGVRLMDGENTWATPWHGVALRAQNGFCLVKRQAAETSGAQLKFFQGKYAFFEEATL